MEDDENGNYHKSQNKKSSYSNDMNSFDNNMNDMNQDANSEIEDNLVSLKPRLQKTEVNVEDDEFVKAFESLLTENIAVIFFLII